MSITRTALFLLVFYLPSLSADEPKQERGDPTKDKPHTIKGVHKAILRAVETGSDLKAEMTLPVNQLHYLPEIPKPQFAGITLRGSGLTLTGGSIPGRWGFKGSKPGQANLIVKIRHPQKPGIFQVSITVKFEDQKPNE